MNDSKGSILVAPLGLHSWSIAVLGVSRCVWQWNGPPVPKMQLQWGIFCLFFRMFNNKHPKNSSFFFQMVLPDFGFWFFQQKKQHFSAWNGDIKTLPLRCRTWPCWRTRPSRSTWRPMRRIRSAGWADLEKSATFGGQNWGNRDFLMILLVYQSIF